MRSSFAILAVALAAITTGQAQGGAQNPSPSSAQSTSSSKSQASSSAAGGHKVLQPKTQDEYKAYQDATAKTDAAQMEAAADAFAAKYPTSEMKGDLYNRAMFLYARANNGEKTIAAGRKAIAADPTNPVPLVQVASVLAETTRDTDMDRDQRLDEAAKDAHAALENLDSGLMIPPNTPPATVAAFKTSLVIGAYDALGMVNLSKKDFAAAEQALLKAADNSKANPEATTYLRLSVAQDQLKKYPEAMENANKAVQLAPQGSPIQNLAKQEQARVRQLMDAAAPAPASTAPATAAPAAPATQTPPQTSPNTPH